MKKLLALLLAGFMFVGSMGTASAEEDGGVFAEENFSATLTMTTDYIFRGVSFTGEDPAIQGSFDWGYGNFFVGIWGSNIKGETLGTSGDGFELELDYYAGYWNSFAGFDWWVMPIYYHFPGASDSLGEAGFIANPDLETDQFEIWFEISRTIDTIPLSPTFTFFYAYSPDFTLEDGDGNYVRGSVALSLAAGFGLDGGVGYQDVEGEDTTGSTGAFCDTTTGVTSVAAGSICDGYSYTHWDIGLTNSLVGFDLDLRYHDTDDDKSAVAFFGDDIIDDRLVFTISRSF